MPTLLYRKADMDLSLRELEQAVGIRRQINALEKRYANLFGGKTGGAPKGGRQGRRMSAAARAKIAAAARARWARIKGKGGAKPAKKGPRRKGGLTAASRKKLSDMMKARWAARRRAGRR